MIADVAQRRDRSMSPSRNDVKMDISAPSANRTTPDGDLLVSVIIPTFNRGWIITEAIESAPGGGPVRSLVDPLGSARIHGVLVVGVDGQTGHVPAVNGGIDRSEARVQ